MLKTITLIREVKGRKHKTILREAVPLHIDILEKLFNKCLRKGLIIDINNLIDTLSMEIKEKK